MGNTNVLDSTTEDGYYHYGKLETEQPVVYETYSIGDTVSYKGINFYVIAESDSTSDSVTLLKAEPLTLEETLKYGSTVTSATTNGYGKVYYDNTDPKTANYAESDIKSVLDAWAADKLTTSDLKEDSTGYSARLITYDELLDNLGYENSVECTGGCYYTCSIDNVPSWVYNSDYSYWTMSQNGDFASSMWCVYYGGDLFYAGVYSSGSGGVVRPVITLKKSAIK